MPTKRSFSSMVPDSSQDQYESTSHGGLQNKKRKLRRLPNVYSKVLELRLRSSSSGADVSAEQSRECFRFIAKAGIFGGKGSDVWAKVVEDHPGIKKLLVSASCDNGDELFVDEMGHDMLRFRLPANAFLEGAKAVCVDGEVVVVVPKSG